MEPTILKYIVRFSLRQQITLLLMTGVSLPFLYFSLDLPKQIINKAVAPAGADFPVNYLYMELDQVPYLLILCSIFLALVLINGAFKYNINVYTGLLGERMLRRLRYDLYAQVLRFPLGTFRKLSQGEIIQMITTEVEPLGGYIGMAISTPAQFGGQLLTTLGFLFVQDWVMGLAAVALYPFQLYIIPKLQRKVNMLGKERVREVRRLSDRIGETVSGVLEVHAHDTSNLVLADMSHRLGTIFDIRYRIYKLKFFTKFLNNFINQLGPFFYYSIGGYLVIQGDLSFGALVAALAAYKDLAQPWKELLLYYQIQQDSKIKYEQVISQFSPAGMLQEELQFTEPEKREPLEGEIMVSNVTVTDDQEINVIEAATLRFDLKAKVALVGPGGGGKEEMAQLLARLIHPTRGRLSLGEMDYSELPEAITGRRISFVGQSAFVFSGTLGDNLVYGLKHRPLKLPDDGDDEAARTRRERWHKEAEIAANLAYDLDADWVDYEAAGVSDAEGLSSSALRALAMADMDHDVYQLGLRSVIDPAKFPDLAEHVLKARFALRERLQDPQVSQLVEVFDRAKYNSNATMAENLIYGTPVGDSFDLERFAQHPYVLHVLDKVGLTEALLQVGRQLASAMVEMFADLPPDHELFAQFSFISADELPDVQTLLTRAGRTKVTELSDEDREVLLSLPFKLIPARHRLGLVDDALEAKLLEARQVFAEDLPEKLADQIEFFSDDNYNAAANLQDNILFGKVVYGQAQAVTRVGNLIAEVVDEEGLRDAITSAGLTFNVGIAGSRLSASQRQKLAIARCILKRPDVLIVSEATATLDSSSQSKIMKTLLEEFAERCVVWSLHRASLAQAFDRIYVLRGGRVVENGSYAELDREGTYFRELLEAE